MCVHLGLGAAFHFSGVNAHDHICCHVLSACLVLEEAAKTFQNHCSNSAVHGGDVLSLSVLVNYSHPWLSSAVSLLFGVAAV